MFATLIRRNMFTSTVRLDEARVLGRVKWYDIKKGFGFIIPDAKSGLSTDVFVHQTSINSATGFRFLKEGMEVSFDAKPDKTGRTQAYDVSLADGSPVKVDSSK